MRSTHTSTPCLPSVSSLLTGFPLFVYQLFKHLVTEDSTFIPTPKPSSPPIDMVLFALPHSTHLLWGFVHIKISPTMHFKGKRQTSKQHVQHDLADKNIHKWVKPDRNNGRKYHRTLPNALMYFLLSIYIQMYVCICIFFLLTFFVLTTKGEIESSEAGQKAKCRKPPIHPSSGCGGSRQSRLSSWLTGGTRSHRVENSSKAVDWLSALLASPTIYHLIQVHYWVDMVREQFPATSWRLTNYAEDFLFPGSVLWPAVRNYPLHQIMNIQVIQGH